MYKEDYDRSRFDSKDGDEVYSKPVRAGKRTYFFDVKTTRGNKDYYLTITESKRRNNPDGSFTYDKHKIFLYKDIKSNCFNGEIPQHRTDGDPDIEFEDL